MKDTKANNVLMGLIGVVSVLIIVFSVLAIDCNSHIQRQQSCQNNIAVTSEQLWQSFPG
jgi:hypothetical protein